MAGGEKVNVRLSADDELAMEVLRSYLRTRVPVGIALSDTDVVRYALHSAANLAAVEMVGEKSQDEESTDG